AEDGIRDGHVTGVQTCALPILCTRRSSRILNKFSDSFLSSLLSFKSLPSGFFSGFDILKSLVNMPIKCFANFVPHLFSPFLETRSEERRVGKECRSRWWL